MSNSQSVAAVSLLLAFLPFIVSLFGRGGIWKFLAFVLCCSAGVGAVSVVGFGMGLFVWLVAWIFAAIALGAKRADQRFARLERQLAAQNRANAYSPVDQLLQPEAAIPRLGNTKMLAALLVFLTISAAVLSTKFNLGEPIEPNQATDARAVAISTASNVAAPYVPEQATRQPPFIATVDNEPLWRADNPPAQWPKFTVVPGEKPLPQKTAQEKIELADRVISRWRDYKSGKSPKKPTMTESGLAVRYLLTVSPSAPEYKTAWGMFIRARQVDREISNSN